MVASGSDAFELGVTPACPRSEHWCLTGSRGIDAPVLLVAALMLMLSRFYLQATTTALAVDCLASFLIEPATPVETGSS